MLFGQLMEIRSPGTPEIDDGHSRPRPPVHHEPSMPVELSPRQLEILPLLAEGKRQKDIGAVLGIGMPTVHHHIAGLYSKLGVNSAAEAVAVARARGLVG